MRLKATKSTIGLLAGLLVLVVAIAGGVFYLQREALAKTLQERQKKEEEVRNGRRVAQRLEEAQTALAEDQVQLRHLESGVTDAAYVPTLLRQLEELAQSTSNRVLSVRPEVVTEAPTRLEQRRDPEAQAQAQEKKPAGKDEKKVEKKKPEPYTPLGIRVDLVGSYQSCQEFLRRIQQFPKIVSVEQLQLRPSQGGAERAGQTALAAEMKIIAFMLKQAPPAGGPAEPERPAEPGRPAATASAAVGGTP